jgi:hypothetical protein
MTRTVLLAFALLGLHLSAPAQVVRINRPVGPRPMISAGSISVIATPAAVSFNLVSGGAASGSSGISITTQESGISLLSMMSLYGYFASASALADTSGDTIPSSDIFGQCATGTPTAYTAFTQTGPFASGSSLLIWQSNNLVALAAGRTDVLSLKINLSTTPQLPAGSYSGTLFLQVQAF